jgi:hypothetical protein
MPATAARVDDTESAEPPLEDVDAPPLEDAFEAPVEEAMPAEEPPMEESSAAGDAANDFAGPPEPPMAPPDDAGPPGEPLSATSDENATPDLPPANDVEAPPGNPEGMLLLSLSSSEQQRTNLRTQPANTKTRIHIARTTSVVKGATAAHAFPSKQAPSAIQQEVQHASVAKYASAARAVNEVHSFTSAGDLKSNIRNLETRLFSLKSRVASIENEVLGKREVSLLSTNSFQGDKHSLKSRTLVLEDLIDNLATRVASLERVVITG